MRLDWSRFWLVLLDEANRMWWVFGLGVLVAAFIKTFKWDKKIRKRLQGRTHGAIAFATAVGLVSPLCSCGIVPLVISLIYGGVPLAPVFALLITSPLMSPDAFLITLRGLVPVLEELGAAAEDQRARRNPLFPPFPKGEIFIIPPLRLGEVVIIPLLRNSEGIVFPPLGKGDTGGLIPGSPIRDRHQPQRAALTGARTALLAVPRAAVEDPRAVARRRDEQIRPVEGEAHARRQGGD